MMAPFKQILRFIEKQPLDEWSNGVCYAASELNMRSFSDQFVARFEPDPVKINNLNQVSGYFFYREDGTFNTGCLTKN